MAIPPQRCSPQHHPTKGTPWTQTALFPTPPAQTPQKLASLDSSKPWERPAFPGWGGHSHPPQHWHPGCIHQHQTHPGAGVPSITPWGAVGSHGVPRGPYGVPRGVMLVEGGCLQTTPAYLCLRPAASSPGCACWGGIHKRCQEGKRSETKTLVK